MYIKVYVALFKDISACTIKGGQTCTQIIISKSSNMDVKEAKDIIATYNFSGGAGATSPASANIVPSGVACFVKGVTKEAKDDLLDLFPFAALVSSHDHNVDDDIDGWYSKYYHIFSTCGLVTQSASFQKYREDGNSLDVDSVVLKILSAVLDEDGKEILKSTMAAMKALGEESGPMKFLASTSKRANT